MLETNLANLPEPHLGQVKEYLETKLGLHYTNQRNGELNRKLYDAAKGFGFRSTISFVSWLLIREQSKKNLEKLASYLTIGETYFLRENEAFQFLKREYLPSILEQRNSNVKKLNIWSAGCSSGEEVYSLASMLIELIPDIESWQIKVTGTDINPSALEKARRGIYSEWSFRKTPNWFMNKYVSKLNDKEYAVSDKLRKLVEFKSHNLAMNNRVFYDQDIILCRNVLIYFSRELIKKVTSGFYDALKDGGVLILSPVEVSLNICERFIKKFYLGRTFFIKNPSSSELFVHKDIGYNVHNQEIITTKEEEPVAEKNDEEQEFERMEFLFREGLYLRVENLIYKKNPDITQLSKKYKLLLAKTLANKGEYDKSEDLCWQINSENGYNFEVMRLLVNIYMDKEDYKQAYKIAQIINNREHDHILCLYQLGKLELKLGYEFSGLTHLKKALELTDDHDDNEVVDEETGITTGSLRKILKTHLNRE